MEGTFEAVVYDAGLSDNKFGKGQESYIAEVQFQIVTDGAHKGAIVGWSDGFSDEVFGGKSRTQWTFESLRTLGLKDDDLSQLAALKGARAQIVVEQGKKISYVKYINPPGGFKIKAKGGDESKAFAEKMKAKLKGAPAVQGGTEFDPAKAGWG
jgi:hypothetical protein